MDRKYYDTLSGGILLIGLGVLFLTGRGFWPWILVVIAFAQLPTLMAQKKGWMAWQGFFWLMGMAVLFASGRFWPGILILLGVTALIGALTKDSEGSPFAGPPREEPSPSPAEPSPWQEPPRAEESRQAAEPPRPEEHSGPTGRSKDTRKLE